MPGPSTRRTATKQGTVSFNGTEATLDCAEGETILLAGLRAGLPLPYECASGGCGACKVRLVEGRVHNRWAEATGLTERDHRRGDRILMCQSIPDGDSHVRVALKDDDAADVPTPQRLDARLVERRHLTADTAVFTVEVREPMPFLAGQFVQLEFPDGARRAYSMTHPHRSDEATTFELLVRAKPGGTASEWLFERLAEGDDLLVEGPYGRAYAQSPPERRVICLAGGTGTAPVLAIAGQLAAEAPGRRMDVYVGARSSHDLVLADRFAALQQLGANVVPVVDQLDSRRDSQEHDVLGSLRTGLALDHLAADHPELGDSDIYLAGPTPMIDAALRRLVREGTASADRVFLDRFS